MKEKYILRTSYKLQRAKRIHEERGTGTGTQEVEETRNWGWNTGFNTPEWWTTETQEQEESKCEFAQGTVTYLGKIVGQGQVRPVRTKVLAIDQFPQPTTKKELMRFLGIVGHCCQNFSTVVAPLTNLLSSKVNFRLLQVCYSTLQFYATANCFLPSPWEGVPRGKNKGWQCGEKMATPFSFSQTLSRLPCL